MAAALLDSATLLPCGSGAARRLVVLCHGWGADGRQLLTLAHAWTPALPDALFAAPHAPDPAPVRRRLRPFAQWHSGRRAWFDLHDRKSEERARGVRRAAAALDGFIDEQLNLLRLPASAYSLVGFSQGAALALFTGLRRAIPPRGIVAIAGPLTCPDVLRAERRNAAPVLLVHGGCDRVISPALAAETAEFLRIEGVPVQAVVIDSMPHEIVPAATDYGRRFLVEQAA